MTDGSVSEDGGAAKTPTTLLARLRERDAEAWRRLVHLYGPLVYRWCRQAGLREADAADLGQEVFLAVSRAIAGFHRDQKGDTFRGWLRTITRNKVRDFFRRMPEEGCGVGGSDAQTRLDQVVADEASGDDDPSGAEDKAIVLRRAVEALLAGCKEETRQAFLRVVVERQAPAEVARDLGISVNAVYLAKSRTLRQLREQYADLIDLD
jgi:RNA polymerase sigma-70 factor (ECF subfamily)